MTSEIQGPVKDSFFWNFHRSTDIYLKMTKRFRAVMKSYVLACLVLDGRAEQRKSDNEISPAFLSRT